MWKKNRENNSNKKLGGGVPFFNVFSRKKIASLIMAGVMIATPIMLAGCSDGKDGANGADGTMWYTGVEQPEESQGKIGDFFYDTKTSTIYIKKETGWESQGSIKGATGSQGEQGNTGAKGDKGDKGDKGNTGATGEDGATWITGTAITGTGTSIQATIENAKVGDLYFNTDTCNVYTCTAENTWDWLANIKGTTGNNADNMEMQVSSGKIQWRYKTGTDTTWKDLIAVSDLKGATGDNGYTPYIQDGYWYINNTSTGIKAQGEQGNAGKKVEIQKTDTAIQWKYDEDAEWQTLVELSALKGATGDNGKSVKIAVNDNNIQWRYTDDSNDWQTIIAVDTLKGSKGEDGTTPHIDTETGNWFIGETNTGVKAAGTDGREIELNVTTDYIQWQYKGDSEWTDLIPLSSLKGADGATWHKGTTLTTTNLTVDVADAKNGDFYLNTSTYDIFQMENNAWTHIGNIKGEKGSKGDKGDTGSAGATWLTGTAVTGQAESNTATVENSKVGDLYFNTNTCDVYTCTAENTWKWLANIKGSQGEQGDTGAKGDKGDKGDTGSAGATWLTATTDPTNDTIANENDLYLNTTSGNIFKKTSTGWDNIGNIKGAKGDTGSQGETGNAGATWLTGTAITGTGENISATITGSKVGDLYFNTTTCDVYTCTAENTWKWLANIKGSKGEDGTSVYVGYDGYIWCGTTKTEYKAQIDSTTTDASVWEDTIAVANANGMGKYFGHEYVDMSKNVIALMSYYKVHAQMTIYGNSEITEIQFISENAGQLDIGTAKVSDIAHAGATVESLNTETTKIVETRDVVAGLNTITFDTPLVIAEDETLILGGSNSTAKLYVAKDIPLDDEYGNFTRIDGTKQDVISKTGTSSYVDTLAVRVKANACTYVEKAVDSSVYSAVEGKTPSFIKGSDAQNENGVVDGSKASFPVLMQDKTDGTTTYQGKTITRIGFLLGDATTDTTTKVWVYRFNKTNITNNILYFGSEYSKDGTTTTKGSFVDDKNNYIEKYELTFTDIKKNSASSSISFSETTGWTYTDCNIAVGEDELLGVFAGSSDLVWFYYCSIDCNSASYSFYEANGEDGSYGKYVNTNKACHFAVDMYYEDRTEYTFEQHLASLEAKNNPAPTESEKATAISSYTKGKNISILGDSLSTFAGYSNDSTNTNLMIGDNISTYGVGITGIDVTSVDQTWWKQTADMTGMNVLVNNSSSGSMVTEDKDCDGTTSKSGLTRCEYLDANTGDNSGTTPDIIAVNMGINDMLNGVGVATFKDNYTLMIQKIKAKYKDAKIFVFTLPKVLDEAATKAKNGTATFVDETLLTNYNKAITEVAQSEGCTVVEVYPNYSWTADNWETYCTSGDAYGHPLAKGMDLITNAFIDTLYKTYVDASSNSGDSTTSNTSSDASIAENTESTTTNTNDTTTNE